MAAALFAFLAGLCFIAIPFAAANGNMLIAGFNVFGFILWVLLLKQELDR